jgi:pyruvate dehydrogenase (quinone)
MAKKRVADLLVDVLAEAGVRRIFGVSGDSLNGITDSIRSSRKLEWIYLRHEETAAFAAGAEAHLTGRLAVCAGSCGPGNLHLINGLYDCHRNRVPVLAIAAQIPSKAETADQVRPMIEQALRHDGSALVEAIVSRQELSMPPTITIGQIKGFSLFMIKAVLDGRGNEIIDLAKTNLVR